MLNNIKNQLSNISTYAVGLSKVAIYTAESYPIRILRSVLNASTKPDPQPPKEHQEILFKEFTSMLKEESHNINEKIYSSTLVNQFSPAHHLKRYISILIDSIDASIRAKYKINKKFTENAVENTNELPDYYARNFHYQTDGYLSHRSAEIYEHQTEILFQGTLGLMRRLLLGPLIKEINDSNIPVSILEVGCGTGETTEILLQSCPNISVTAVDLSGPYINLAQEKCKNFSNLEFIKGNASELKYGKNFDYVISSFLFHELPYQERKNLLNNLHLHLKDGGASFHIDSIQKDDKPEMNWALIQFPKDFHEPFYKNYTESPMTDLLAETGITKTIEEYRFLSKSILGRKS